jgi:hypothetical protein
VTTANFEPIWGFVWSDFWSPNGFFSLCGLRLTVGLLAGATDACCWVWLLCESGSVGGDVTRVESESAFCSVVVLLLTQALSLPSPSFCRLCLRVC